MTAAAAPVGVCGRRLPIPWLLCAQANAMPPHPGLFARNWKSRWISRFEIVAQIVAQLDVGSGRWLAGGGDRSWGLSLGAKLRDAALGEDILMTYVVSLTRLMQPWVVLSRAQNWTAEMTEW
jgi:hypothetical protein